MANSIKSGSTIKGGTNEGTQIPERPQAPKPTRPAKPTTGTDIAMTESKMPERIWATHFAGSKTEGKFSIFDMSAYGPYTAYRREDLAHPAPVADAELEALDRNADALLDLDAKGVLVPHGIGGLARGIIEDQCKAITALRARTAQPVREQWFPIETAPYDTPVTGESHHHRRCSAQRRLNEHRWSPLRSVAGVFRG